MSFISCNLLCQMSISIYHSSNPTSICTHVLFNYTKWFAYNRKNMTLTRTSNMITFQIITINP